MPAEIPTIDDPLFVRVDPLHRYTGRDRILRQAIENILFKAIVGGEMPPEWCGTVPLANEIMALVKAEPTADKSQTIEPTDDAFPATTITSDIQVNEADDIISIFGTRYTLALFRALGADGLAIGAHLKIVGRDDGAVHLQRIYGERDTKAQEILDALRAAKGFVKWPAGADAQRRVLDLIAKALSHVEA